ncbi:hypothetical protein AMTR_s00093p00119210 [Amborella trichopoda]|uniref:Uncharacterized protein n=1 Tax=Amborella trichopoda TaxID=13333 RepID=W1NPS0_AMBTC|nr:hypothetical protein AMTR_s00093p00119210 [Amborella trichopoda]
MKKMGAAGCIRFGEEKAAKEERKIGCWSEVVCSKVAEVGEEEGSGRVDCGVGEVRIAKVVESGEEQGGRESERTTEVAA